MRNSSERINSPEEEPENNKIITDLKLRSANASSKIQQRIEEIFIPNLKKFGDFGNRWLMSLQNDFYALVEDPNHESGGGNYKGWSAEEIKELYFVLYNEELE